MNLKEQAKMDSLEKSIKRWKKRARKAERDIHILQACMMGDVCDLTASDRKRADKLTGWM